LQELQGEADLFEQLIIKLTLYSYKYQKYSSSQIRIVWKLVPLDTAMTLLGSPWLGHQHSVYIIFFSHLIKILSSKLLNLKINLITAIFLIKDSNRHVDF
jgi:hypothetical protein